MHRLSKINLGNTSEMAMGLPQESDHPDPRGDLSYLYFALYPRGENSNDHDAAPKRTASVVLSTNKLVLPRRPPD